MGRLILLFLFAFLSMCSSSASSKSSSESLNPSGTIHFATGGAAHGEGSYVGGQGEEGGSGLSTPKVPSSAAVIPVTTGGGAINNHHGGHPSDASSVGGCLRLQTLATIILASCCIFPNRI